MSSSLQANKNQRKKSTLKLSASWGSARRRTAASAMINVQHMSPLPQWLTSMSPFKGWCHMLVALKCIYSTLLLRFLRFLVLFSEAKLNENLEDNESLDIPNYSQKWQPTGAYFFVPKKSKSTRLPFPNLWLPFVFWLQRLILECFTKLHL